MATPIIQIDGAISGVGTPGVDRAVNALETVTLTDTEAANVGASYQWSFDDVPLGSAPTLVGDTTPSPTFAAPALVAAGTVRIRCTVNAVDTAVAHAAVLLPVTATRIPAYLERDGADGWNGGGNTKGWHEAMTDSLRALDAAAGASAQTLQLIQTQTVGVPGQSVTFAFLTGDADETYKVFIDWIADNALNCRLIMKPNNITASQVGAWVTGGGAAPASVTQNRMVVAAAPNTSNAFSEITFPVTTGPNRKVIWQGGSGELTLPGNQTVYSGWGLWLDAVTNVTTLTFETVDAASVVVPLGLLVGTRVSLYKVAR